MNFWSYNNTHTSQTTMFLYKDFLNMWTFLYEFLKDSICVLKIIKSLERKSFGRNFREKISYEHLSGQNWSFNLYILNLFQKYIKKNLSNDHQLYGFH